MPKPDPNIPRAAEAAESEGRQFARLITPLRIPQPRGALGVGAALTALATAMIGLSTGTAHAAPQRPASASAVPASALPTTSQLRREVDRVVAAGVPGVVVLIRDGRRIVRVAGGSARLKPQRSMRVDDRFRIASLTKT